MKPAQLLRAILPDVYKGVPRAVEPETDPDPAQTAADLPADGDSFDGA